MEEKIIQNLLTQISEIVKVNKEKIEETGASFNMFQVCGVSHYENTHSAILAELLNPNGSHTMKAQFLQAFIEEAITENFPIVSEKCYVQTELSTEEGRIDIFITDDNYAICIENKVYAEDQWEQLKRYATFLEKNYSKKWKILYLTLDGREASEQSGKNVEYTTLSYSENIVNWLEKCIRLSENKPIISQTLLQYQNHIKKLTGSSLEEKYMEKTLDLILKNKENFEAAVEIQKILNSGEIYNKLLEPFVEELRSFLKTELEYNKIESDIDIKNQLKIRSNFSFNFIEKNFRIGLWFNSPGLRDPYFGLLFNEKLSDLPKIDTFEEVKWEGGCNLTKWVYHLWPENIWTLLFDKNSLEYKDLLKKYKEEINLILPTVKNLIK